MKEIINEINKAKDIVILCHIVPDGDAIGSSLGLYNALKTIDKNVDVIIPEAHEKFSYIDGFSDIKITSDKDYDLAIIVDTSVPERINAREDVIKRLPKKIVIDHHVNSNPGYGDLNLILDYPAAAVIIYKLISEMGITMNKFIATAIYTGLLTDTGSFAYGNITPEIFQVASKLCEFVDIPMIHKKAMGTITKGQYDLKKMTMEKLEFYFDNRVAYSYVTDEDLRAYGAKRDECNVLLSIPREIEGVEVCILFRIYDDYLRISMRSVNLDLHEIAKKFGGGGHNHATGITIYGEYDVEEIKKNLLKEIEVKLNEWDNSSK